MLFRLAAAGHVSLEEEGRYDVRTETPILAFLASLQDITESASGLDALTDMWKDAKAEFLEGSKRTGPQRP